MGSVPLTIFFMACLAGFYGNSATASSCSVSVEWPKKCENKAFCLEKPEGYPTTSEFLKMQAYSKFNFSNVKRPSQTSDRDGFNLCRQTDMEGSIYMIKDTNDGIRYVVQDPELFVLKENFRECKEQIQLLPSLTCYQNFTEWGLPVTTCDGKGIELYKLPLPTYCAPGMATNYDY